VRVWPALQNKSKVVMPLLINLRNLDTENLELKGELSAGDLELEGVDELIKAETPLRYDLEAQKLEKSILVQGDLGLTLRCECVRCLKPFDYQIELTDWACLLSLEGEDQVPVSNDCIDLTPAIREDILLGFPQYPACEPECGGLREVSPSKSKKTSDATGFPSSALSELDKLKL